MDRFNDSQNDPVASAVEAWRAASYDEGFSGSARSELFESIQGTGVDRVSFVPTLARAWRWAFLGSIPVVAIAAVLMVAGEQSPAMGSRLSVSKTNGQVVFTLANGRSNHMVYRSTDPQSFNRAGAVKMARNQYSENVTGGPTLVFYRID